MVNHHRLGNRVIRSKRVRKRPWRSHSHSRLFDNAVRKLRFNDAAASSVAAHPGDAASPAARERAQQVAERGCNPTSAARVKTDLAGAEVASMQVV